MAETRVLEHHTDCLRHHHFTSSVVASPAHPAVSPLFLKLSLWPNDSAVSCWVPKNAKKPISLPRCSLVLSSRKTEKSGLIILRVITNTRHPYFCKAPFRSTPPSPPPKKKLHKAELRAGCTNLWQCALFRRILGLDLMLWCGKFVGIFWCFPGIPGSKSSCAQDFLESSGTPQFSSLSLKLFGQKLRESYHRLPHCQLLPSALICLYLTQELKKKKKTKRIKFTFDLITSV